MTEQNIKKDLGSYLKEIRQNKNLTAKELGEKINYSQSYISGVENAQKALPRIKFITNYLEALSESSHEYNKYVDDINKITKKHYVLSKIDNELKNNNDTNIFHYVTINGEKKKEFINAPINDLSFHLNDLFNFKSYGDYILSDTDLKNINDIVYQYLKFKLEDDIETSRILADKFKTMSERWELDKENKDYRYLQESKMIYATKLMNEIMSLKNVEEEYNRTKKR